MRKHFDDRDFMVPKLQAYEDAILKELEVTQVTHVTEQYQPGSERLDKLYAAMDAAARFQWPRIYVVNV